MEEGREQQSSIDNKRIIKKNISRFWRSCLERWRDDKYVMEILELSLSDQQ